MKRNYLDIFNVCVFAFSLVMFASCEAQPIANTTGENVSGIGKSRESGATTDPPAKEQEEQKSKAAGIMDIASKLMDQAKDSGGQAIDQASGSGQDVMDYASEMYKTLKKQGLTKATDASSWLREDFNNMNAIEYKVLRTSVEDPAEFEATLNEMGKARWECFHVQEKDGATTFYFKKPRRSYMRNIPMRDMIRMVPFMGNGE